MNSYLLIVCICEFLLHLEAAPVKLPKGFIHCKQNDPHFQECVGKAINAAIPELVKGVPRFALPSIDPLRISTLYIDQGSGPVSIKMNFTDLDILGIHSAVITESRMNMEKNEVNLKMDFGTPVVLDGTYSIIGKVLILPISGNGHSKFTLSGFKATSKVNFKTLEKNGEIYWDLEKLDFDFTVTKLHIIMENLFNGDKALGDNMNIFLNENWPEILQELQQAFRAAFSSAFSEIARRFFDRVPIDQVFPKQ